MDGVAMLPTLLAALFKSAQSGTLVEIVETAAKLVRLIEPLIGDATISDRSADPETRQEYGKVGLVAPGLAWPADRSALDREGKP